MSALPALVFYRGEKLGLTPLFNIPLPVGVIKLKITLPGTNKEKIKQVELKKDQEKEIFLKTDFFE